MKSKNTLKPKKKVLVALSGGIDSAVSAALLLKQGYAVEAGFMKNWSLTEGLVRNECPWLDDRREALKVAAFLNIPLHTFDFEKQYQDKVMQYFFKEYKAGRTPNPDVMCNKEIKFGLLYDKAIQMGFDYIATGHYAQIKNNKLIRSVDEFKDQTYFIYNLKKEQLKHILFPIGHLKKTKVRQLAKKLHLPNANRKESMGLCFVGKIRLDQFLSQKLKPKQGNIVDTKGNVLGTHKGTSFYTLGQRQGLGIGGNKGPYYIAKKDVKKNLLIVTEDPHDKLLEFKEIHISGVNWINAPKKYPVICKGRFRHQQSLQDLKISKVKTGYNVKFKKPQFAIASGQSLVLYKGKECLGGGVIV
ncbi:MAG: tRNA-specific 2-thiouridylase [Candidatus Doudnabacteria bacterium Gr01-1014_77]|uniref:tRNA-specific 2-thiouridylase MnmA n=1 Tax=Candidatus Doudnabacteria bacterium Gr01-1014_77 TaxID=2017133 RepID=A0A554JAK3_9BACT|nr:MAG: tRNA-specific 2-thiouridylase [Candidatus Doudnabacteria bacterium Gr01-1014_77]